MILLLALRSLLARPVRSAVLAGGFGLGVAVMAALLGIGGVILEQARTPALVGGGDVVIAGQSGRIGNAKFVLSEVLGIGTLGGRMKAASPSSRAATLTPSPYMSSPTPIMSPILMPMRNAMRLCGDVPSVRSCMVRWISTAHRTASTSLSSEQPSIS